MKESARLVGGLWGAIVGDALGVPVEFTSREQRLLDPVIGMRGNGTHQQPPGTWSDDSSLLLITVETLCDGYAPERLAGRFIAWQEHGYWTPHGSVFDIGIATSLAIARMRRGILPEEAGGIDEHDNGNGSLMRILPVALHYRDAPLQVMCSMAHRMSALTHRHPRSRMACGLYCCMAKALLEELTPEHAYLYMITQAALQYTAAPYLAEYPCFTRLLSGKLADIPKDDIASSGYAVHTLEAAIWCLLTSDSFAEAVLKAVNLGDDTDTTGCVTGGLAGITFGINAIPRQWINTLATKEDIEVLFARFAGLESRREDLV